MSEFVLDTAGLVNLPTKQAASCAPQEPMNWRALERLEQRAQNAHDETGIQHCVLNYNTSGRAVFVMRRYEGPNAYANENPGFVVFVSQVGGGF